MTDALFMMERQDPFAGRDLGDFVVVDGDEGKHAVAVRRIKPGEWVYVADGQGSAVHGEVIAADKRGLQVQTDEILTEPEPRLQVTAVQALAKGDRSELAVETMTELGISRIIPWQASRSIVRWSKDERGAKQLSRWQSTAREASKQSRRFRIPEVSPGATTKDVCAVIAEADLALILHEDATTALADVAAPFFAEKAGAPVTALIITGPEGGISPDELEAFCAAGATPVLVARHVLRASTAGVVALAQLQALAGMHD